MADWVSFKVRTHAKYLCFVMGPRLATVQWLEVQDKLVRRVDSIKAWALDGYVFVHLLLQSL